MWLKSSFFVSHPMKRGENLKVYEFLSKHFLISGTLLNLLVQIIKWCLSENLGWQIGFMKVEIYMFAVVVLLYITFHLFCFLRDTFLRLRDEKEDRLALKIASKINGDG